MLLEQEEINVENDTYEPDIPNSMDLSSESHFFDDPTIISKNDFISKSTDLDFTLYEHTELQESPKSFYRPKLISR